VLLGAAYALDDEVGAASDPSQSALRDDVRARLEDVLGDDEAQRALARRRALDSDEAVALALTARGGPPPPRA